MKYYAYELTEKVGFNGVKGEYREENVKIHSQNLAIKKTWKAQDSNLKETNSQ